MDLYKVGTLPDYLWGIETRTYHLSEASDNWLPDYLWGIETFSKVRRWIEGIAPRLPMRNWNSVSQRIGQLSPTSSQTTYEELKPFKIDDSSRTTARSQTTYEELKLRSRHVITSSLLWLPDYLWGIETFAYALLPLLALLLPDYLWGIETDKQSQVA